MDGLTPRLAVESEQAGLSWVIRAKAAPSPQHEFIPCIELAYRTK